jgi:hypothetical protein
MMAFKPSFLKSFSSLVMNTIVEVLITVNVIVTWHLKKCIMNVDHEFLPVSRSFLSTKHPKRDIGYIDLPIMIFLGSTF